ncbi:C40 family peptidase [Blastococcus sp. CCUG 61487]|uniref:C40 family peptidase n=1 Tax=Blastococcus sp. CCUG 61487 TaxID=1840703 RepID=UPI00113E010A|nr:C40 family peptidase [Blastococcus sp. CCUG 61487]TKJ20432.1 hydrolase [Blastococcus sp. CCUG 61487]
MATPHALPTHAFDQFRPARPAGTARRMGRLRAGLLIGATTALTLTVLPGTAVADPVTATSPAQAAELVADASHELEVVSEELNEARVELERQRAAVDTAELAALEAAEQRAALDGRIRQLARSAYTQGGASLTQLDVLLTSRSADEFVSQLGTLDAIAGHTNAAVRQVADASERAEDTRAQAEEARQRAERTVQDIEAKQQDLEARIADYQRQFEALDAAQRAVVERAHGDSQPVRASRSADRTAPVAGAVSAPSGAAQVAVDTALAQVGDRYVWGASGPDAFDCSGLTSYAYAAAGVSLPHSSRSQSQMGRPVSRGELQPGDLVFFYSPVSHVGMYIGNGQMVHASTSSQPVKVASVDSMGSYNSARRIVG